MQQSSGKMQDWGPRGPQFESGSVYFSAFENKGINIETIFNYVYFEVITFVRLSIVCFLFLFLFLCVCTFHRDCGMNCNVYDALEDC